MSEAREETTAEGNEFEAPEEGVEAREEALASERGLPDSASNDNPLPLEAVDATVNKAEGDHEALAENAYQAKVLDEAEGQPSGLTSVEESLYQDLHSTIEEEGATAGPAPDEAPADETS